MNPSTMEIISTVCFGLAILHTFLVSKFEHIAHKHPEGSIAQNFWHFMGEVEVVFGMWAAIFISIYALKEGVLVTDENHQAIGGAVKYLEGLNFTEAAFVFVVMAIAGTRPIVVLAEKMIGAFTKIIFVNQKMATYKSALILGPLLGSFITEPAAMTVTALILLDYFFSDPNMSRKFKYATIGLLFVNISIGGTLTHFAAPPVLMVAGKWHWGIDYMISHIGWKAIVAILINTNVTAWIFSKELKGNLVIKEKHEAWMKPTWWMTLVSLIFLGLVIYTAHHMVFFLGIFLFFLGFAAVTTEFQDKLKLTESLLVGFFLGGLVTLGSMQSWWISPLLEQLGDLSLFYGATALTAITDNAALTYLGSLVEGLSDSKKYYLVAGAVAGGGLTVIANAPNPAGFGILKHAFGEDGINPMKLFLGALAPTIVALICLQFLPDLPLNM
ncbi:MAG: hypothetical protein DRQ88_06730 [Epsilonproteobacteria bacterium]|nr:MAG: hypothetical protein DRQ89_02840 [Campylobacterota bacterium]RLA66409.1 MAG: hypothetical protein DRQ88_06730 [Campylobacterota bacterium]